MGVGPVEGGVVGRCLGRVRIDRLVEVRSNCYYFALNCAHTRRTVSSFPWPGTIIFVSSKESGSSTLDGWPRLDGCQIETELCLPRRWQAGRNADRRPLVPKTAKDAGPSEFQPAAQG
jgi:hypothetical protein